MKTIENKFDRVFRKQLIESITILAKGDTPVTLKSYRIRNDRAKAGVRKTGYEMQCLYCEETFEAKTQKNVKYCSATCRTAAYRARKNAHLFITENKALIHAFLNEAGTSAVTKV